MPEEKPNPNLWWGPRWQAVLTPGEIHFRAAVPQSIDGIPVFDIIINGKCVGWLEKRHHYCDRGHWKFECELPGIDEADSFPRYYMDETRAKLEIISWLNWRLWRMSVS
jgi:hypothetical protein